VFEDEIFLLYPNPSQNQVTFLAPNESNEEYQLIFVDIQGKVVLSKSVSHSEVFEIDLPNGVYFVQLNLNGKQSSAMRLMVGN